MQVFDHFLDTQKNFQGRMPVRVARLKSAEIGQLGTISREQRATKGIGIATS